MPIARRPSAPPSVVPRLPSLDEFVGMWVAVKDDEVIAAAETSSELAHELHKIGARASGAVMRFVSEPSRAVMVGLG